LQLLQRHTLVIYEINILTIIRETITPITNNTGTIIPLHAVFFSEFSSI